MNPPEVYAAILGTHFVEKYKHIHVANVSVIVHKWTRMTIGGKPHPHSFLRDGSETRVVEAIIREGKGIEIRSSIKGLLVLKSTGSAFYGFDTKDEFTILPETTDRILSTEVECGWKWKTFADIDAVKASGEKFNPAWDAAKDITLETFATESSPSVQATMYKMCEQILEAVPETESIDYTLPNKHYFEISKFLKERHLRDHVLTLSRLELAQGHQEHRQGRRSVRSAVRPQWSDPLRCLSQGCGPEAVNAAFPLHVPS